MNRKMYATFFAGFLAGAMAVVFLADLFVNAPAWLRLPRAEPAAQIAMKPKAEEPELARVVPLADLDVKTRLAGRLGHPLGRIVTIRGEWIEPLNPVKDFADLPIFRVDSVNGKYLQEPVEFTRPSVRGFTDRDGNVPHAGDFWEMRGTELGGYLGLPPELFTDAARDPAAQQVKTPYGFYTYFFCSRVRVLLAE